MQSITMTIGGEVVTRVHDERDFSNKMMSLTGKQILMKINY